MEKFKDIKTGDIVYINKQIRYAYSKAKHFYIPQKVTKVTKTQFVIENGDRFKKDGRQIGKYRNAYFKGDNTGYYGYKEIVSDRSNEMKLFVEKITSEQEINESLKDLECPVNSDLDTSKLLEVKNLIDKLTIILNYKQ